MVPTEVGITGAEVLGKEASAKLLCRESSGNNVCSASGKIIKVYK